MTDTVGFIRNLPKDLFAAFRATFEEAADADLLLHVVDASDSARDEHMRTVLSVLDDLDLTLIDRVLVFSKVDLLEPSERWALERSHPEAAFVSAITRETTRPLIERIARELASKWEASSKGPSLSPVAPLDLVASDAAASANEEMTTLDQMLRAAGKRVRSLA
jgi:GTP-binding protein HflX